MPTPTYDLIEEKVLVSAEPSVTFNSIPGTYKDLVLECVVGLSTNGQSFRTQINGDTGNNYSNTVVYGDGIDDYSYREQNISFIRQTSFANNTGTQLLIQTMTNFMSYANTNVNKTAIMRSSFPARGVDAFAHLWRSTSAITSLSVYATSGNMDSGSTFRLWGVLG